MEFAFFFVVMSCEAKQFHLCLLTCQHGRKEISAQDAYSLIAELKPSPHVMAYNHGFKTCEVESPFGILTEPYPMGPCKPIALAKHDTITTHLFKPNLCF